MKLKQVALFVFLLVYEVHFAQHTDIINSNRPSESMGAFAVGKNVIQVEGGLNFLRENHHLLDYKIKGTFIDMSLRYGFLKEQLEFIADISYQNDKYIINDVTQKRSGLRNTTLGFKYLAYDPFKNAKVEVNIYSWKANHKFNWKQFIPAVSGYAGMNLNFSSAYNQKSDSIPVISPKVMVITQNMFGGGYVLIGNIFMDKISTPRSTLGYVVTVTRALNDKWSVFLENKGLKSDYYSDGIFSVGGAYLFSDDIQIDASISTSYKNTPTVLYGGIGISWRSDVNYKDIFLKDKSDNSKNSKGKKDKEKDKKKRLDEVETPK